MSMAEQIRQASAGEQVKLPVPAQLPAIPINETTPSFGSEAVDSTVTSPPDSSLPSMVENTSPGGSDEEFGNRVVKVHNVGAGCRIPTSFSLI